MKFVIDVDGTITWAPEAFSAISGALVHAGHEVHILTGTMDTERSLQEHLDERRTQMEGLGIKYTHLYVVRPPNVVKQKADYCQRHNIDLVFEDSDAYIDGIKPYSKCLRVVDW